MSNPKDEYRDVTEDKSEDTAQDTTRTATHNASPQIEVLRNNDPALQFSHEHQHSHLHHSDKAVDDRGMSYSKGTTDEPSNIPKADMMDDALHRRHVNEKGNYGIQDAEAAETSASEEEDPRRHRLSNLYRRFRPFVHLFIFLLFTG